MYCGGIITTSCPSFCSTRPVVRGTTRLHADSRRRQLGEEFDHVLTPDLAPQQQLLVLVNPVNLKDMLGRIQTNSDNRHSDGSYGCVVTTSQPGTFDAGRGRPPQHLLAPEPPKLSEVDAHRHQHRLLAGKGFELMEQRGEQSFAHALRGQTEFGGTARQRQQVGDQGDLVAIAGARRDQAVRS